MSKPSIRRVTLRRVVNLLLLLAMVTVLATAYSFRQLTQQTIYNQAMAHAEIIKAGLTAHMKADVVAQRGYFLDEIKQLDDVKSLRVIRGDAVTQQFGEGHNSEFKPSDDVLSVFATATPLFILDEYTLEPQIRAIIPYVASSKGGLDCLGCHQVDEGTVLGAVDLVMDIREYVYWSYMVLAGVLLLSMVMLWLVLLNTSRAIKHHIQQPLNSLIRDANQAYHNRSSLDVDGFASQEFSSVAKEFNLFNDGVLMHQQELLEKSDQLQKLNYEIEKTLRDTVFTMGEIEERRSNQPHNHIRRMTEFSRILAELANLSPHDVELVTAAIPLHDIGKIGIPDEVLLSEKVLSEEQVAQMEQHPLIGYAMLKHSNRDILQAAAVIALQHHEHWDGGGYPMGLVGDATHIYARITHLVGDLDLMLWSVGRDTMHPLDKVLAELKKRSGQQYEPILVSLLVENIARFIDVCEQYPVTPE